MPPPRAAAGRVPELAGRGGLADADSAPSSRASLLVARLRPPCSAASPAQHAPLALGLNMLQRLRCSRPAPVCTGRVFEGGGARELKLM